VALVIDEDARQYDIASVLGLYDVPWVGELWTAVRLEAAYRIEHGYPPKFGVVNNDVRDWMSSTQLGRNIIVEQERKGRLDRICTTTVQFHNDREVQP
jgi:hypothetical protein